jgi:glycosyltransferase domain-containing protein
MARLFIPTRNRPTGLSNLLNFLVQFYPNTEVIVADGGKDYFQKKNIETIKNLSKKMDIDYRPHPYELPLFQRILDVLQSIEDEFIIMGSDDDYPMMDVLKKCENFLKMNPDHSTALGSLVHLFMNSDDDLTARLDPVRSIKADTPLKRANAFSQMPFSTTYAVTRREFLLERYDRASKMFLSGFFDFSVGLLDCMFGKIHAYDTIGFICTRNYNHSYIRPDDKLLVLRRSEDILRLVDDITNDLISFAFLDRPDAEEASANIVRKRIVSLAGVQSIQIKNRSVENIIGHEMFQKQFTTFLELFENGSKARAVYGDRLSEISKALTLNAHSQDNEEEKRFYETLEKQLDVG